MIFASAPGRIALFGEHMDWLKRAVIAAAIDMRTFLLAEENTTKRVVVKSYKPFTVYDEYPLEGFDPNRGGDLRYVRAVVKAMLNKGYNIKGVKLEFIKAEQASRITKRKELDLPVKKGLSSSAAISVACAAALYTLATDQYKINTYDVLRELSDIAYIAERKILGINCGQMDQYTSAFGSILYIDCSKEPAKPMQLNPKIELNIVIGDTRQKKDTPRILGWLGKRYREREQLFMEGLEAIADIVEEARKELSKEYPDIYRIGELMNQNQYYLKNYFRVSGDCPISPNNLDKLIEAALDAGALGAKLTGSGGGGAMIALTTVEKKEKVAKAIEKAGGKSYVTKISEKGIIIREYIKF